MKRPQVGDVVRVTINLHGRVSEVDDKRALVYWKRGKRVTIRESCRFFSLADVIPADEADQKAGIRWRLIFYLDDAQGALTDGNISRPEAVPRQPWTPYPA